MIIVPQFHFFADCFTLASMQIWGGGGGGNFMILIKKHDCSPILPIVQKRKNMFSKSKQTLLGCRVFNSNFASFVTLYCAPGKLKGLKLGKLQVTLHFSCAPTIIPLQSIFFNLDHSYFLMVYEHLLYFSTFFNCRRGGPILPPTPPFFPFKSTNQHKFGQRIFLRCVFKI